MTTSPMTHHLSSRREVRLAHVQPAHLPKSAVGRRDTSARFRSSTSPATTTERASTRARRIARTPKKRARKEGKRRVVRYLLQPASFADVRNRSVTEMVLLFYSLIGGPLVVARRLGRSRRRRRSRGRISRYHTSWSCESPPPPSLLSYVPPEPETHQRSPCCRCISL